MATHRRSGKAKPPTAQLLPFPRGRGGARKGAGRKPSGRQAGVPHDPRATLAHRHPVHVTIKLRQNLPRLRQRAERAAVLAAFAAGCRGTARTGSPAAAAAAADAGVFRLCQYSVQDDHLHLMVEAQDRTVLARGLQGLLIRIARALNKLWQRRGSVFADRYHATVLTTPRQVRNTICYVFGNARKHAAEGHLVSVPQAIDTFTSAPWFDGFRERFTVRNLPPVRPIADARTWLLTRGWRRHGLLSVHELPSTA